MTLTWAVEAPYDTTTDLKLFSFSAAERVDPFPPQDLGWGNSEKKMECANSEKPSYSKGAKKKKGSKANVA